ncbi:MAG TPA: rhomboid family intramembrane serine protease [Bacteroidales bacterium]|nr:rhomboid family intramembrane serine protease [Bacteroidales bacterium]
MNIEKKRFIYSLIIPLFFIAILWIVKGIEIFLHQDFSYLGIFPMRIKGLIGIVTAPLIHSDIEHLAANSIPLLILGSGVFYFYNKIAYKVFFFSYLIANIWIWFGARYAYHIGASGLVYSLASFLFFSGVFRRNIKLMAVSLTVVFLYGSMVWGLLPIQPHISWESHLMGAIAGLVLSVYYKDQGPKRKIYSWELEDEEDEENEEKYWEVKTEQNETGNNEK